MVSFRLLWIQKLSRRPCISLVRSNWDELALNFVGDVLCLLHVLWCQDKLMHWDSEDSIHFVILVTLLTF